MALYYFLIVNISSINKNTQQTRLMPMMMFLLLYLINKNLEKDTFKRTRWFPKYFYEAKSKKNVHKYAKVFIDQYRRQLSSVYPGAIFFCCFIKCHLYRATTLQWWPKKKIFRYHLSKSKKKHQTHKTKKKLIQ